MDDNETKSITATESTFMIFIRLYYYSMNFFVKRNCENRQCVTSRLVFGQTFFFTFYLTSLDFFLFFYTLISAKIDGKQIMWTIYYSLHLSVCTRCRMVITDDWVIASLLSSTFLSIIAFLSSGVLWVVLIVSWICCSSNLYYLELFQTFQQWWTWLLP